MSPDIDHECVENYLVCPYCGNRQEDTDFCSEQRYEGEEECSECHRKYAFQADFTIEWSTRRLSKEDPACRKET